MGYEDEVPCNQPRPRRKEDTESSEMPTAGAWNHMCRVARRVLRDDTSIFRQRATAASTIEEEEEEEQPPQSK